jgi:hypothetical protein
MICLKFPFALGNLAASWVYTSTQSSWDLKLGLDGTASWIAVSGVFGILLLEISAFTFATGVR